MPGRAALPKAMGLALEMSLQKMRLCKFMLEVALARAV